MKKICLLLLSALLVLAFSPSISAEEEAPNYGFIPSYGASNSDPDAALVSKVLLNGSPPLVVARYYTAPRLNQVLDADLAAIWGYSAGAFPINPYAWRTNRIAMDPDGNAWVVNTGVNGPDQGSLQGTIVRIQGDTTTLTTTSDGTPLDFGTDEAVQVFAVGAPGDVPRVPIFDNDGYLWIGFHMAFKKGGYFQKYAYDPCAEGGPTLTSVGDPVTGGDWDPAPYNADIDSSGIIWFSSYGSNAVGRTSGDYACDHGVYSFNSITPSGMTKYELFPSTWGAGYGILVDDATDIVYATSLNALGYLWTSADNFISNTLITGLSGGRGMAFDDNGILWIASSGNGKVCWFDPSSGTSGASATVYNQPQSNGPVGIGKDADGYLWVVLRTFPYIARFDPSGLPTNDDNINETTDFLKVQVGNNPYAYGDFTNTPVYYEICGYKYKYDTTEGLEGWEINLYNKVDGSYEFVKSVMTDSDGHYCFTDLLAGDYKVTETSEFGWFQKVPDPDVNDGAYSITLAPADPCNPPDPQNYNFENQQQQACDETAWGMIPDGNATCFSEFGIRNWGWSNEINASGTYPVTYQFELWAGAGRCDTSKGTLVGSVSVTYDGSEVSVTYVLDPKYYLLESHVYIGTDPVPEGKRGRPTVAPGQFPYQDGATVEMSSTPFYVLAHAVVASPEFCEEDEE